MKKTKIKNFLVLAIAATLVGVSACSNGSADSGTNSVSSSATDTKPDATSTSSPDPDDVASDTRGRSEAPVADALAAMEIPSEDGTGEVELTLDAVEHDDSVISGKVVSLLAFTVTARADGPSVKLAAPIDGGDLYYASSDNGEDAVPVFEMMLGYSESWTGRSVDVFHGGPYEPGVPTKVVQTLVTDRPGGALIFVQPDGNYSGPIEIPGTDEGLPNESITEIHEIMSEDLPGSPLVDEY